MAVQDQASHSAPLVRQSVPLSLAGLIHRITSAAIFEASPICAPLPCLGSIYAVEANSLAVNIDRIPVDDAGAPDDRFRRNCRSREE